MATEPQTKLATEITNTSTHPVAWSSSWVIWDQKTSDIQQEQKIQEIEKSINTEKKTIEKPKENKTTEMTDSKKEEATTSNTSTTSEKQEPSTTQSSANPESSKDEWIITKSERNEIGEDLKKSFKDIWRIPYLLVLPIINLIQGQYEKIPESRRQGFARMTKDIKESGKGGIQKIKDWRSKKDEKKEELKPETQTQEKNSSTTQAASNIEINTITPQTNTWTSAQITPPQGNETNNWTIKPMQTTINVETDTGQQIKVTTTIEEGKKTSS